MIYLYSGTPGSGKSLHVARDILFKLKRGQTVIANFPIVVPKKSKGIFKYYDNSELTVEILVDYAIKNHKIGIEGQSLIVIDECSVMFNPRDFSRSDRMKWITFLQQHRKFGYNIILISQSDRLIDRQIRCYIEYDVRHRSANNLGIIGLLVTLFGMKLFACVTYWYGLRERIAVEFFFFRKIYAKIYDSYMIFSGSIVGTQTSRESQVKKVSEVAPVVVGIPKEGTPTITG